MPISDTPILSMLRTRMHWHQERQRLLSENVANADTPSYKARDLAPPNFDRLLSPPGVVALARTDVAHLGPSGFGAAGRFQPESGARHDVRPTGNAVTLEDEMLKVAANQMDYQAATSLYGRSLGLIKSGLGKR